MVIEAGCVHLSCQISVQRRVLICHIYDGGGGATTVWYQILDRIKDLAISTLPRREREQRRRELTRVWSLVIRESQSVFILALVSSNSTPRVERGREEG